MSPERYGSPVDPAALAKPLQFSPSGKTAKNRLMKAPMGEKLASWSRENIDERGIPTDELIELYKRWGEGKNSWGVIVTGNIQIDPNTLSAPGDMIIPPQSRFEGQRFDKFKQLATAAKADGSLFLGQVSHPGRQVEARVTPYTISASDLQLGDKMGMTFARPHAASKAEIADVVEAFAHAAEYLDKAGFDGIELHAAHGYLLSQFLSRTTNLRADEYGAQTMASRVRLISEIARAIKARVSRGFIVAAKLNSVEFQDGGVTADEARELCEALEVLGLDFVELSGGTYEELGMSWKKESTRKREAFFLEFAETITKSLAVDRKLKTYLVGGFRSAEAIIKGLEVVDGVALARPSAAEPRLARHLIEGTVTGAIKPTPRFEDDIIMGMGVGGAQIAMISRGMEPFNHNDPKVMQIYSADMGAWFQKVVEDGSKLEYIRNIEYSGPQLPYGTAAV